MERISGTGRGAGALLLATALVLSPPLGPESAAAQDAHIMVPIDTLERLLREEPFEVVDSRGSRAEGDRTSRVVMAFPDQRMVAVKWAPAAWRGDDFNNSPRYEAAAYEIQKLFLDPADYVVPTTVLRAVPLEWHRRLDPRSSATFPDTESVLVTLQYWLFSVRGGEVLDEARLARDSVYARHVGNLNTLSYLIRHNDANEGNFLISSVEGSSRVFAVDNGLAFGSEDSSRGTDWRRLRVDRLPAGTVDRLRTLSEEDLVRQLETVAQFRVRDDGQLERMEVGRNISRDRGVRRDDGVIQLGLTRREIRDVWRRLQNLLEDVDRGRIATF